MNDNHLTEDILKRISLNREFNEISLQLTEQSRSQSISKKILNIINTSSPEALKELGIKVLTSLDESGTINSYIVSNNIVGCSRLIGDSGFVELHIEPKVGASSLVSILNYLSINPISGGKTNTFMCINDLLLFQVEECIKSIRQAFSTGFTREYIETSDLILAIKGKPDLNDLLLRQEANLAKQKCRYSISTLNTTKNQIYKHAISICMQYLAKSKSKLSDIAFYLNYSLGNVENKVHNTETIAKEILKAHDIYTKDSLSKSRDIIKSLTISPHPSRAKIFQSYKINMATLFQNYITKIFENVIFKFNFSIEDNLQLPVGSMQKSLMMDGCYCSRDSNFKIIVECKYKEISTAKDISLSDLYQLVAYSTHKKSNGKVGILIYPNSNFNEIEPASKITYIDEFREPSMGIHVLQVSLSHNPESIKRALEEIMATILGCVKHIDLNSVN